MKIIPFILLLFVLACGQIEKSTTPTNPPIAIKADALTREYKENELAADSKYKNKILEVSGRIESIAEVFSSITVDLEGHSEGGLTLTSVKCTFPESEKTNLLKLKTGQNITFQGTNEGMTANLYVGLDNCRLKP